jgi:hypothetical protein
LGRPMAIPPQAVRFGGIINYSLLHVNTKMVLFVTSSTRQFCSFG